jgi:hypothetical protein
MKGYEGGPSGHTGEGVSHRRRAPFVPGRDIPDIFPLQGIDEVEIAAADDSERMGCPQRRQRLTDDVGDSRVSSHVTRDFTRRDC